MTTKRSTKKRTGSKAIILVFLLLIIFTLFSVKTKKGELSKQTVINNLEYSFLNDIPKPETDIKYISAHLNLSNIKNVPKPTGFKPTDKDYILLNKDLGNSYVEIDLTRQKVWVYVDRILMLETDCVTGCVNKGHETPTGIFNLTYKESNRILRGQKLSDGSYEYESHVDYWMPFNGGIGLHDASWRDSFGGDIYINNGSHGCINLPLWAASKLYNIINDDMPIIVYKS